MKKLAASLLVTLLGACAGLISTHSSGEPSPPTTGATVTPEPSSSPIDAAAQKDHALFAEIPSRIRLLSPDFMPGDGFVAQEVERAAKCRQAVDTMLAAGVPRTYPYVIENKDGKPVTKTVDDLKPRLCEALQDAANAYVKEAAGMAEADRAKFTKFGIDGDKLDLMLSYDGSVFLPGGASSEDLKKYAAAKTLFIWLTSDPDDNDYVVHTVRRYQFNGNALAAQTERTYRKKNGEQLGAAPFK